MQTLDTMTPEQVIEVSKLSQDRIPQQIVVSLENPGHYFLSSLSDSPSSRCLRVSQRRLLDEFHSIFYAKWTSMQFWDKVACPSGCNDRCFGPDSAENCLEVRSSVRTWCCLSLLVGVQHMDKLLMYSCDGVAGSLLGALLLARQ